MTDHTDPTYELLNWLCRDYQTNERWKTKARKCFLATIKHPDGDADSSTAREYLAQSLQVLFRDFAPRSLVVEKWKKDFSGIEKIPTPPPTVSEDNTKWDWIADYLLLSASVPWKEYEEMNSNRQFFNSSLQSRSNANQERVSRNAEFIRLVLDEISAKHNIDVDLIAERVREKHFSASSNTKSKKRTKLAQSLVEFAPIPLIEEDAKQKISLPMISLYRSKYFPDVNSNLEREGQNEFRFD